MMRVESLNFPKKSSVIKKNKNKVKINNKQLNLLDSVIIEGKKRLEIVSFILGQVNYLVRYRFKIPERDLIQKKSRLNASEEKFNPHKLSSDYFLIDSEIIILYICQAILAHDISVLNNQRFQELKATYAKLNISVEKIAYLIYVIKTSVLDFLHSTTFNNSPSELSQICGLDTEIANYFDVVIASMI